MPTGEVRKRRCEKQHENDAEMVHDAGGCGGVAGGWAMEKGCVVCHQVLSAPGRLSVFFFPCGYPIDGWQVDTVSGERGLYKTPVGVDDLRYSGHV